MVYKVTTNTELQIPNHFSSRKFNGQVPASLWPHHLYIILFYACFCIKAPYLTYTAHLLILTSWLTGLQLKSDEDLICVFSIRHMMIFLCLGLWRIVQHSVWEAFYFGLINQFWENKCIFFPVPCCVLQRGLSHKGPWGKDREWVLGSAKAWGPLEVPGRVRPTVALTQLLLQPQRNYWLADSGTPGEGEGTMRNHHIKIQCKVKACLEQGWMTQQETCFQDLAAALHNFYIKQKVHTYYLLEIIP